MSKDSYPLNDFEKNGFAVLSNQISEDLLDEFNNEFKLILQSYLVKAGIDELNTKEIDFHSKAIMNLEEVDHSFVAEVYDTIFQCPSFLQIVSCKEMINPVKTILKIITHLYTDIPIGVELILRSITEGHTVGIKKYFILFRNQHSFKHGAL